MIIEPRPVSAVASNRTYLFHGRSGTGKTTLFSTFRQPSLLLDIKDQGTDSISDQEGIDKLEVSEFQEIEDIYWWLRKQGRTASKYKTIGIDTITQMQDLAILQYLRKMGKNLRKPLRMEFGTLSQKGWIEVAGTMKEWITNFRDLALPVDRGGIGVDVVFLAQERVFGVDGERDEGVDSTLDPEVGARLSPSVVAHLNAVCSVIGSTAIRIREHKVRDDRGRSRSESVTEYVLRIGPSPYYVTKIRKPRDIEVPDMLVNPTYRKLIGLIKGDPKSWQHEDDERKSHTSTSRTPRATESRLERTRRR